MLDAASAASNPDKKRGFDLKKLQDKKREEEKIDNAIPQDDPLTVKLRGLTNDITEDDIWGKMRTFGEVLKVKIPMEEFRGRMRSKGIAFVTFKTEAQASRALTEAEVNIDSALLSIERALKTLPRA